MPQKTEVLEKQVKEKTQKDALTKLEQLEEEKKVNNLCTHVAGIG